MHRIRFAAALDFNQRHPQRTGYAIVLNSTRFAALLGLGALGLAIPLAAQTPAQPHLSSRSVPTITVDGLQFRDLNRDGKLEPFEDWRLSAAVRAKDLALRLSLEEKAGLMLHASAPGLSPGGIGRGKEYDLKQTEELIEKKKVSTFITRLSAEASQLAKQNNLLQELAERSRFAIPLTISTDPRNNFRSTLGAQVDAGGFTQWPDMPGMAAIGDPVLTRQFGDIARREYLAVGITEALSPQADLDTEPRWPRQDGTFGEDPQLSKKLVEAYIAGFQNGETGLHPGSVSCVVKHWVGYGAMKDGLDGHNAYGRVAVFPGNDLKDHLIPFEGAFAAKVAGVMPTYAILQNIEVDGKPLEQVAAGFNKQLLTGLLREKYGFDGVIVTDWLVTDDCKGECLNGAAAGAMPKITPGEFGMPWGVEDLTPEQRYAKALAAGVDQFGGVSDAELLVDLVHTKQVEESRLDESVVRILTQKFALGLFESPYVDPDEAAHVVGKGEFVKAAIDAQERSMVLLSNIQKGGGKQGGKPMLPLDPAMKKVYLVGVDAATAGRAGLTVVATPAEAQFAIVRLSAPFQKLHPGYFFGSRQHEGDLDFKSDDPKFVEFEKIAAQVPTVAAVYLDRPAILTPIVASAGAVLANFGSSDEALLAVVLGTARPGGKLPFQLPKSMEEVRAQKTDVPADIADPLFPLGFGLRYDEELRR
jgi:beta-glucosidase